MSISCNTTGVLRNLISNHSVETTDTLRVQDLIAKKNREKKEKEKRARVRYSNVNQLLLLILAIAFLLPEKHTYSYA